MSAHVADASTCCFARGSLLGLVINVAVVMAERERKRLGRGRLWYIGAIMTSDTTGVLVCYPIDYPVVGSPS